MLCRVVLCCVVLCSVVLCCSLSPAYREHTLRLIFLVYWACSRKSDGNAEGIRDGRTMPYAIRESWLSMNTVPFRTVSEWTSTLIHIYACSNVSHAHLSHKYGGLHSYTHTYIYIYWTYKQTFISTYMRTQLPLELNINQHIIYRRERGRQPCKTDLD